MGVRIFTEAGTQTIRRDLLANATLSHLAYLFRLDELLIAPPQGSKPNAGLETKQNIAADLFEAHMGALVEEGREVEVLAWVDHLVRSMNDLLDARVQKSTDTLVNRCEARAQSRKAKRPRSQSPDEGAAGGDELARRASYEADPLDRSYSDTRISSQSLDPHLPTVTPRLSCRSVRPIPQSIAHHTQRLGQNAAILTDDGTRMSFCMAKRSDAQSQQS